MNDINLLSPIQKQKRLALSLVTYLTIGFFTLLISVGGFALTLTTIQLTINDRSTQYSDQNIALDRQIKAYSSLETDVSSINQSLNSINTVLSEQLQPVDILTLISSKINANTTLSGVAISKASATDTSVNISLSGTAKDRDSIIIYKRELETIPTLQNVTYTITAPGASKDSATSAGFGFTISATYQKGHS